MNATMSQVWTVAAKDLRVEGRSKVVITQVLPFAIVVLVLFGLALDADRTALRSHTPGLFWVTVLFAALLVVQRSVTVETLAGTFDAFRLAGVAGWKVFGGKALAVAIQLLVVELILAVGVFVLYRSEFGDPVLLVTTGLVATAAIAAAGSLYGVLVTGMGVTETILPLLLLPVLAPVLIAATRAFGDGLGTTAVDGWAWCAFATLFAVIYTAVGAAAYGAALEDS